MDYYVKHGDSEKGPFPLASLRDSLDEGELHPSTLVRSKKGRRWVRLDALLEPQQRAEEAVEDASYAAERARSADGERNMMVGGLICLAGIVITAATYSSASGSGGHYVVAWGAIVFGGIRFFRGLSSR